MYTNVGKKIKDVTKVFVYIGILYSIITGISYIVEGNETEVSFLIFFGIVVMTVGSFISWILGLLIYGLGQLIENTDILAGRTIVKKDLSESDLGENVDSKEQFCPNCGAPHKASDSICWSCKIRLR